MGIIPMQLIYVIVFLLIGAILVFIFKQGIKILNIIVMVLLLIFCWFTFFTEKGSVRFAIALRGHPVIAYTTDVTKDDSKTYSNFTYYKSSKDVVIDNKVISYIKCETKWIIRISSIEE